MSKPKKRQRIEVDALHLRMVLHCLIEAPDRVDNLIESTDDPKNPLARLAAEYNTWVQRTGADATRH